MLNKWIKHVRHSECNLQALPLTSRWRHRARSTEQEIVFYVSGARRPTDSNTYFPICCTSTSPTGSSTSGPAIHSRRKWCHQDGRRCRYRKWWSIVRGRRNWATQRWRRMKTMELIQRQGSEPRTRTRTRRTGRWRIRVVEQDDNDVDNVTYSKEKCLFFDKKSGDTYRCKDWTQKQDGSRDKENEERKK